MKNLTERDQQVIWHPYTQMLTASPAIPIVKGKGAYLFDEQGKRYLDAVSSWWVTLHGHAHPYIAEKVASQLLQLEQVIFAGFTHRPAIELAEALLDLLPENQQKVFYTDNGSTAIEVALKMCLQYWSNKGQEKQKILAFTNAYHGDTFGAMSVSGRNPWTKPFDTFLFDVIVIDPPSEDNLQELKTFISSVAPEIACFIYEPLVQGSAGMLMHSAAALDSLLAYCREEKILLIQDEVFTGFGRTGKNFACDHLTIAADVMCFSKGLTGGTMPLGATTCTNLIYEAFLSDDRHRALFHGHSFTANPLACTAALASIELLLQQQTQEDIERICKRHQDFLLRYQHHPKIRAIRQTGTILAIEWQTGTTSSYFSDLRDKLYHYFLDEGILLRPLGNIIYLLPPYCISDKDLNDIYKAILKALEQF
ncbi:adenosylmethionine--8-amino-7-oxononanoate transaminase [Pedobacter sp. HMWF019]|uniref:adenosylmethionine--8-amino-7-oxononanoate transaminase n=1 Tax=Pedobacter sp. HMWF019 TaxID=2056856 RepID=UPI000D374198|nr:adenosylmethionine--8-amino-7-oxononanoate transaminase [Pedobacter sp. HMWF019]PTT01532.1 adenosylmethionine--8-amino-7-oxononanoate transaminase [Pedobacter sp. HMWF019]